MRGEPNTYSLAFTRSTHFTTQEVCGEEMIAPLRGERGVGSRPLILGHCPVTLSKWSWHETPYKCTSPNREGELIGCTRFQKSI